MCLKWTSFSTNCHTLDTQKPLMGCVLGSPVNHSLKSICEVYYTSSKVFLLGVLYSNFTHHNIIFQESISQNILVWVLGWGLAGGSF